MACVHSLNVPHHSVYFPPLKLNHMNRMNRRKLTFRNIEFNFPYKQHNNLFTILNKCLLKIKQVQIFHHLMAKEINTSRLTLSIVGRKAIFIFICKTYHLNWA